MMKSDEKGLLLALAEQPKDASRIMPRDVAGHLGIPEKRAEYILNKWIGKGWFECGVSVFSGWLLPKGLEEAQKIKATKPQQRTGMLKSFDDTFEQTPMDEATVNAAVDWLIEQGSTLFDACVVFASSPCPEKGWQWVLARFDRLTNGEEKYTPGGERRCNKIRQAKIDDWFRWASIGWRRPTFVINVLNYLSPDIDPRLVEKAAQFMIKETHS